MMTGTRSLLLHRYILSTSKRDYQTSTFQNVVLGSPGCQFIKVFSVFNLLISENIQDHLQALILGEKEEAQTGST